MQKFKYVKLNQRGKIYGRSYCSSDSKFMVANHVTIYTLDLTVVTAKGNFSCAGYNWMQQQQK
jgi:hypothetical protein